MPLTFASLASFARVESRARKGFAQRTQRTPRLGKAIAEMSLFHMGIDHEWTRIFTNGEGSGNGRDEWKVARGGLFAEGVPGSVSPATTESAGGVAYRLEGGMKDLFLFLRVQTHHA